MVRILSSVNLWACVFWILATLCLLLLSGPHLWLLSMQHLLLLSGPHFLVIVNAASSVAVRVTPLVIVNPASCVASSLHVLFTARVVFLDYHWGCVSWLPVELYFSWHCWDCVFWLPLELPLLVTTKVTSFVDKLTVLPGVRAVKSSTQSGSGTLRVEFRLQRKREAHDSSDPSFPQLGLHLPGKDGRLPFSTAP